MGAEHSFQTSVSLYHIVLRNVPINDDTFSHALENFKSYDWIVGLFLYIIILLLFYKRTLDTYSLSFTAELEKINF
jgi:hypothetical protein